MSKAAIEQIGIGAALVGASFLVPGIGAGLAWVTKAMQTAVQTGMLSTGASLIMSGAASALAGNAGGIQQAAKNPIGAWNYIYGKQKVGGTVIFEESNNSQGTSNNKELHRVFALACHPCAIGSPGDMQVWIDGKPILLSGSGNIYDSYSPSQTTINISSISRLNGVVTMHLSSPLPNYDGVAALITNVRDNTYNGTWVLVQPNPLDSTTFQYICGGSDGSSSGGKCKTTYPDYVNKIHVEFLDGNHTSTFPGLLSSNTSWKSSDLCLGRTLAYVRMGYDAKYFPSGVPNMSFIIRGKNDILDPRTGTRGYTTNPALCIADYMSISPQKGGFGLAIGTDIPTAQLIAGANVCDEVIPLAAGGTESRYTCNYFFQLNKGRGSVLQDMLASCAGHLSYQGGQYNIFPGAWVYPTLSITDNDIIGETTFHSRHSIRDTCNATKGTYICPDNNYQMGDWPMYCSDADHGYPSDAWLAEDNSERIITELNFPSTSSCATAQRLGKIELLRTRHQIRGTIRCSMRAYQVVPLDVISITHARYGWGNKLFEVLGSRLVLDKTEDTPQLAVELDVAETDPSVYDWSSIEQLTPQGWKEPANANLSIVSPVESLDVYSGHGDATHLPRPRPNTFITGADGVSRNNLWCSWVTPNDPHVINGGHVEVQWQCTTDTTWKSSGLLSPTTTEYVIGTVTDGLAYNVQVAAYNVKGVMSDWLGEIGVLITNTGSSINASNVLYANGTNVNALEPAQAGADVTALNTANDVNNVAGVPAPIVISTINTTGTSVAQLNSVDYLTNSDKTDLMAQWKTELASQTLLHTVCDALTPPVSYTAYDATLTALSTNLIAAGAPSNWAAIWPDSTTSGPWTGIQTNLATWWASIAAARMALVNATSSTQALAAQAAAVATAATDATSKMNTAITAAQGAPVVVSGLPTLPNSTYPANRLVYDTVTKALYMSTGSAWQASTVTAGNIQGTITDAQVAGLAASKVTGTLSDSQLAAISAAKLTGQITGTQITNGAISTPQLAAGAVTAATIAADTITATQIAANAITASELAAGAVVAGKIAAGTIQAGDIAAATITGDRIAANTITAGQLAANTITAGQIAAGAIGAAQIAAGAITTASLTVANFDNLIPNPNSEQAPPVGGWPSGAIEALNVSTAASYSGTRSRIFAPGVNTSGEYVYSPKIPCNTGDQFVFQAYGAVDPIAGAWWELAIDYYNSAGTWVAGTYGSQISSNGHWVADGPSAYQQATIKGTVPSGASFVTFGVFGNGGSSGAMVSTDNMYARRMAGGELIIDGSITAAKISAGAITANMITTGTLDAASVSVVNLNASNITTGTLSASKVLFGDGSALTTASRVLTSVASPVTSTTYNSGTLTDTGAYWSVVSSGVNDTFNVWVCWNLANCSIMVAADGNTGAPWIYKTPPSAAPSVSLLASFQGLSAGAHTIRLYARYNGAGSVSYTSSSGDGSYATCQRIF